MIPPHRQRRVLAPGARVAHCSAIAARLAGTEVALLARMVECLGGRFPRGEQS